MMENKIGKYFLYTKDKFFVKVVYDVTHNVITEVERFKYEDSLDKFNSNIKLNTFLY